MSKTEPYYIAAAGDLPRPKPVDNVISEVTLGLGTVDILANATAWRMDDPVLGSPFELAAAIRVRCGYLFPLQSDRRTSDDVPNMEANN
jgi:hypothetical protein